MSRSYRLISAVAVTLLLAACGQGSTSNPLAPAGPSMDGGYATGGNRTESDSTTTTTSTVPSDTTGRGGYATGGN